MKLDENYSIEKSRENFILRYAKKGDISEVTGKTIVTRDEWYYGTLQDALVSYSRKIVDCPEFVADVIEYIQAAENRIREIAKTVDV